MSDTLTVEQAYKAMYLYLEALQEMTASDDLAGFLGGMSLLADGTTADPAAWQDWIEAIEKARSSAGDDEISLKFVDE